MPSSTSLRRGTLVAMLVAGCLVAPAAMAQSSERGSGGKDPAHANVYVAPSPDAATRQGERWLKAHPVAQDLPDPHKTANVYVPPAQGVANALDAPVPTQTVAHPAVAPTDDGAGPWAVLGLALACVALVGGACLVLAQRGRRTRRTAA
jgi:hypothetical protein